MGFFLNWSITTVLIFKRKFPKENRNTLFKDHDETLNESTESDYLIAKLMQIDEFEKARSKQNHTSQTAKKPLEPIIENNDMDSIDFTSYLDTVEKKTLDK